MGRYVARRLLQTIPVFIGATFLIFALVYAIPGDPIRAIAGDRPLPPAIQEALRDRYNLDDPLPIQYAKYIGGLFRGDFGETFNGRPVREILAERFPVTIRVGLAAFAVTVVLGLAAGVLAGLRRRSLADSLVLVSTTAIISIPIFVIGFSLQIFFGLHLDWLPPVGLRDGWVSYILPAVTLGSGSLAYVARLTRTSLVENLRADYVRTATAKGLSRSRVVGRHTLRNSLIPVVTYLGVDLGTLMSGAIITEGVFNIPGIGREVYLAIRGQENAVVVGIVTALVLIFMFTSLIVDLLYAVLDPRIRYD